jgi:hypothetical protein
MTVANSSAVVRRARQAREVGVGPSFSASVSMTGEMSFRLAVENPCR